MAFALGTLSSAAPIPTGRGEVMKSSGGGTVARLAAGSWMYVGPGVQAGPGFQVYAPARPHRFWWHVGFNHIAYMAAAWERFDWQLQLLPGYAAGADLNGVGTYQKTMSSEGTGHGDPWVGCTIEGLFYCEADTPYWCRVLTAGGGGYYYQHPTMMNMWAYTVGEGVY